MEYKQDFFVFLLSLICFSKCETNIAGENCKLFLDHHDRSAMYSRNFIAGDSNRWPEKTVPYTLSSSFTSSERNLILNALTTISSQTCVQFVQRTNEANYVDIFTGQGGCFANLGFNQRRGRHVLHLQRPSAASGGTCLVSGIIVHEMEHILGFGHEQNRPDRNGFIRINWANIQAGRASQFWRALGENEQGVPYCGSISGNNFDNCHAGYRASTFGIAYDYGSVMHYGLNFFSVNGQNTMTLLRNPPSGVRIPNRSGLSSLDVAKTNAAYKCQANGASTTAATTQIITTPRPLSCNDNWNLCQFFRSFCFRSSYMQRNCKNSCDLCVCKNNAGDVTCNRYSAYCQYFSVRAYCRKMCGVCS